MGAGELRPKKRRPEQHVSDEVADIVRVQRAVPCLREESGRLAQRYATIILEGSDVLSGGVFIDTCHNTLEAS